MKWSFPFYLNLQFSLVKACECSCICARVGTEMCVDCERLIDWQLQSCTQLTMIDICVCAYVEIRYSVNWLLCVIIVKIVYIGCGVALSCYAILCFPPPVMLLLMIENILPRLMLSVYLVSTCLCVCA